MDTPSNPAAAAAAAAESPVTQSTQDAAVALLRGANAAEPVAPAETPTEAKPEGATEAPPTAPAVPPVVPPDDDAALLAELEARKAARVQRAAPDVVAQLQAKIDALEARLAQPPAHVPQDFPALVRQYGEVEAMRMVGIDPMEYFARFKTVAKDPSVLERQRAQQAEAERVQKLEQALEAQGKTLDQWKAEQQQREQAAQWSSYIDLARAADPILAKLPQQEIVNATHRKMAEIDAQYGVEVRQSLTDAQLAKLIAKDYRSLRDLLAGIDPGVSTTPQVPANDGARQPATATLSNDLASQASGQTRPLNEEERVEEAIKLLKRAQS